MGAFGQLPAWKFNRMKDKNFNVDSVNHKNSIYKKVDSVRSAGLVQKDSIQKVNQILQGDHSLNLPRRLSNKRSFPINSNSSPMADTLSGTISDRISVKADTFRNTPFKAIKFPADSNSSLRKISGTGEVLQMKMDSAVDDDLPKVDLNAATSLPTTDVLQLQNKLNLPQSVKLTGTEVDKLQLQSKPSIPASGIENISSTGFKPLAAPDNIVPKIDLPKTPDIPELKLPDGLPTDNAGKIQGFSAENLEDEIQQAAPIDDVSAQLSEADRAKRYFDPQVAKEESLNRAKLEAINHFSGHEQEIRTAVEFLSKAKSKVPGTDNIVDPFQKQNSLKGLSTIERFVPSVTMQLQRDLSLWLDINPALGFRLSHRFLLGAGWNQRVAYSQNQKKWDVSATAFGARSFLCFKFNSLLSVKTETEILNVNPSQFAPRNSESSSRIWVWGVFVGAKKDFNLGKHLIGNVQMLYNLARTDNICPYVRKFNVRLGIELPLFKKRVKGTHEQEPNSEK